MSSSPTSGYPELAPDASSGASWAEFLGPDRPGRLLTMPVPSGSSHVVQECQPGEEFSLVGLDPPYLVVSCGPEVLRLDRDGARLARERVAWYERDARPSQTSPLEPFDPRPAVHVRGHSSSLWTPELDAVGQLEMDGGRSATSTGLYCADLTAAE